MTSEAIPSLTIRVLQTSSAILWCLLAAGVVFGFAALKPILILENIYEDRCTIKAQSATAICDEQDLSLNFLFTVACMVTNISALPVGSILDSYGPRVTGIIGSIILALGALIFKYASVIEIFDGYLVAYTLLALAGPFVFISCFQLANSFPKNSGLILALLTGAFDSSSALFLIYRIYYTTISNIPLEKFFTIYLIVPLFIFGCQIFIMPSKSYKTVGTLAKIAETGIDETGKPIDHDLLLPEDRITDNSVEELGGEYYQPTISETTSLLIRRSSTSAAIAASRRESIISRYSVTSAKSIYEQDADNELYNSSGGVFGIMHDASITQQFTSQWFILMTLFTTIQMLRINYFVATIKTQELFLFNNDEKIATAINQFFDLALPLGGIFSIPFIGLILDNFTTLSILYILTTLSIFIGIMGLLSWIPATYAGIIVLVIYRPFYYTAVSDYCAKVFGYENFGTIYGTIIAFSGICNILQQYMDLLTHEYFNKNPIPVNSILVILTGIFGIALIGFVRSQELQLKRKRLEIEAQVATDRPIPT
ncbi:major facilitator superfamily domain-containing protein [Scheffersomyces amazonensis]|uniref:major facilitator superfamily domain-containing protein n=1 Tax=Scheffersomyces amazonensis TaxID=1078765 RepID=UPI00315D6D88